MAITHETMSLMIQFGGFIVGLLSLVVAIVVALTQKRSRPPLSLVGQEVYYSENEPTP
ncbi:putative holin-like toxin [Brevibacillus aydinogluensis]|uniref:Uncharacterized protein n=1 Tax=Brevibacillus aydinogluensis TaxID=927786 RepID=A0AA48M4A0_9BACL|nr:putative holin-like toxin [Brevibacillus aydinogluensis]CAJ1001033.1 hypothetical protein BSPP4475_01670 [Brevibacillus aydinogluensis]